MKTEELFRQHEILFNHLMSHYKNMPQRGRDLLYKMIDRVDREIAKITGPDDGATVTHYVN